MHINQKVWRYLIRYKSVIIFNDVQESKSYQAYLEILLCNPNKSFQKIYTQWAILVIRIQENYFDNLVLCQELLIIFTH